MKAELKIKRIVKYLVEKNNFTVSEAEQAIKETSKYFDINTLTPSIFIEALLSTYNVNGVER